MAFARARGMPCWMHMRASLHNVECNTEPNAMAALKVPGEHAWTPAVAHIPSVVLRACQAAKSPSVQEPYCCDKAIAFVCSAAQALLS